MKSSADLKRGFDSKITSRYHLDPDIIKNDLVNDRPIWPLSAYGPGRDAPRQLIEGPIEMSPEELRLQFYVARASGNEQAGVCASDFYELRSATYQ